MDNPGISETIGLLSLNSDGSFDALAQRYGH